MVTNKLPQFLRLGGQAVAFITALKGFSYFYEYFAFPVVMIWLGDAWGIVVMTSIGTTLNLMFIWFYDWTEAEVVEQVRNMINRAPRSKLGKLLNKVTRHRVIMFLFLSWEDPLYAVFYFRKGGRHGKSLEGSDWPIFVGSNVMANFVWGAIISWGLWAWTWLWS